MALTDAQRELLEDKYVLWDAASRTGSEELRDYNRRAADALKVLLSENAGAGMVTSWLIEWPPSRQDVTRYWHAAEGRVIDPNHATRMARREDADALLTRDGLRAGARAVEHMWMTPSSAAEGEASTMASGEADAKTGAKGEARSTGRTS